MKKSMQVILISVLCVGFIVLLAFLYPSLPAQIPMQWGLNGKVNYTLAKLPVVLVMIIVELGFGMYSIFLHRNDDKIPLRDFVTALLFPTLFSIVLLITQIHI